MYALDALAKEVGEQAVCFKHWDACLVDVNVIILDAFHALAC